MSASAIERAVKIAGGQSALARKIQVSPQAVQKWCKDGSCPHNRVVQVEAAIGGQVTRVELAPDLYAPPGFIAEPSSEAA